MSIGVITNRFWMLAGLVGCSAFVLVLKKMNKIAQLRAISVKLECDTTGLTRAIKIGDGSERLERLTWESVTEVFAYKKDCFVTDQIRLIFRTDPLQDSIEVTEDDEGYAHLIDQLPTLVVGFPAQTEWWCGVALPPFETQWTRIYSKEDLKQANA